MDSVSVPVRGRGCIPVAVRSTTAMGVSVPVRGRGCILDESHGVVRYEEVSVPVRGRGCIWPNRLQYSSHRRFPSP